MLIFFFGQSLALMPAEGDLNQWSYCGDAPAPGMMKRGHEQSLLCGCDLDIKACVFCVSVLPRREASGWPLRLLVRRKTRTRMIWASFSWMDSALRTRMVPG